MITTINPATGEQLETYQTHDDDAVAWKLARAWTFWIEEWRPTTVDDRVKVLARAADRLDERRDQYAELITREMGKPIAQSRAEIDKCVWLCRHYVDAAGGYLAPRTVHTDAHSSYVRYDPIGPVLAIMPWNFPFWQVFRFAVPSLAAGNVALLSHSRNTTGCALAIEEIFHHSGLSDGGFEALLVDHDELAEMMGDVRIRGVTLTGSDRAGRAVASTAGQHLRKTVLELGGSDPFIVLADADLDQTARSAAKARLQNSGQSCIAAKRFIVLRDVYEDFLERFRAEVEAMAVGDPMDEGTDVGPLARDDLRDTLHDQVQRTLAHHDGGSLLIGGEPLDRPGFFYQPTIIRDSNAEAPACTEETFGPLAAVMDAEHEEAAVALANSSRYGLGASIWTRDVDRGERLAAHIESGVVFVNDVVSSDPRLPFGGMKDSGYGRELGWLGAQEFCNVKTVWVNPHGGTPEAAPVE